MGLEHLAWHDPYDGEDLHVLRDRWSTPLLDRVQVVDAAGVRHAADTALTSELVDVRVTTNLRGSLDTQGTFQAHQVSLVPETGTIFVAGPGGPETLAGSPESIDVWPDADLPAILPTLRVRNFIVTIWATVEDGAGTKELAPLRVRVHVHESVSDVWLTPTNLRLPRQFADVGTPTGATPGVVPSRRHRLLVQFNTGLIGDITDEPGHVWSIVGQPASYSPNEWPEIAPGSGRSTALRGVPTGAYEIAIEVADAWSRTDGSRTAQAELEVVDAWDEAGASERTITDLSNSYAASEGLHHTDILLLGDAISAAGSALFLSIMRKAADRFRRVGRPVPKLFDGLRFFAYAPPSAAGPSIRSAMTTPGYFGTTLSPTELAEPLPTEDVPVWRSHHIEAELDIPDVETSLQMSLVLGDPTVAHPRDYAVARWRALFDLPDERFDRIHVDAAKFWVLNAKRFVPNDADTAFGVARGDRAGFGRAPNRVMGLNPDRMGVAELHAFVESLCLPDANGDPQPVGSHWTTGSGRRLIVIVAAGQTNGGTFDPTAGATFLAIPGNNGEERLQPNQTAPGVTLAPAYWEFENEYFNDFVATLQHELGHAFGLGDEYGGVRDPKSSSRRFALTSPNLDVGPITDGQGLESPAGSLDGTRMRWATLYRSADAWVADTATEPAGSVHWVLGGSAFHTEHGVPVELPPFPGETLDREALAVRLRPGTVARAASRRRPLVTPAAADEPIVVFLRERLLRRDTTQAHVAGPFHLEKVLEIDTGLNAGSWAIIRAVHGGAVGVTAAAYGRPAAELPPVLFRPVAKAAEADGYARLVPVMVRDHVSATKRPFDIAPGASLHIDRPNTDSPAMVNAPAGLTVGKPWWPSRRVVGLWTGGASYDRDIYRSSAQSIMRASSIEMAPGKQTLVREDGLPMPPEEVAVANVRSAELRAKDTEEEVIVNQFNPLSAWLLVEQIDPELHHDLERKLARWDPDPAPVVP